MKDKRIAALVEEGEAAARMGKKAKARRKFRAVLMLDFANLPALLWLAWLSEDPRASLAYVARALTHTPDNPRAHAALRWARRRASACTVRGPLTASTPPSPASRPWWRRGIVAAALGLLVILIGAGLTWSLPHKLLVLTALNPVASPVPAVIASPTPIPSPTPTPTRTLSPTPTGRPQGSPPPGPTATTPGEAPGRPRSVLPTAPPLPPTVTLAPLSIKSNVRWIDIDLANQRLNAYEGQDLVRTTLVSTGLPRTPTPIGRYHVQIKLRYDDMSGPGYYLPNVPYVMYFHGGYGLHGTYWHSNFGHPMSHGCVNLPTAEAEWLYDWAGVGTLVSIHY
jgi:lipoprotein-anchoring transpeptidase ErfK/SrfK